jgi:adenine-specific DNA-methyltransferase
MKKMTAHAQETKSANVIAGNIQQLMSLFPEAVCEGRLDFEILKQLLGGVVDEREEKYGLNWHGKRRARQLALTPSAGTLRPCPEESVDWGTTQNLMIEGDNLEVLKLLQKSYAGKVKLIYIDPPYNTGKDFVYADSFNDSIRNYLEFTKQRDDGGRHVSSNTEASGRFHTNWLNMLYPRLMLAKNLLREEGAIFVSLDDGESSQCRAIMDEIFGSENFVANIIWEKKFAPQNDEKYFSERHDHIFLFAKNKSVWTRNLLPRGDEALARYKNPDKDPRGPWTSGDLLRIEHRDNCVYTIVGPNGSRWTPDPGTSWRHPEPEMCELIRTGQIWFGADGTSKPRRKRYLNEVSQGVVPETIWFHKDCGHNQEATQELKSLFSDVGVPFSNPKPVRLLRQVLSIATAIDKRDIVLDFFAGSGTTGHATLDQNLSDGGNRRYILVQLPEVLDPSTKEQRLASECCDKLQCPRNIAELTKERLRRARNTLVSTNRKAGIDLGFRVFKLDSSNITAWDADRGNLDQSLLDSMEHIKPDRNDNDVLYELLLKLGLDLCVPFERRMISKQVVHSVGAGALIVCLATSISRDDAEPLALGIIEWHKQLNPVGESTVVFRDSAFADDVAKTNLAAILQQHGLENVRSL